MNKIKKIFGLVRYILSSSNNYAKKIGVTFGKNCKFRTKYFGTEPYLIFIGNNVSISANVRFITHDGSLHVIRSLYTEYAKADLIKSIEIGNNVFIGVNTTILYGTIIQDNVIIGAGSVVKGEIKSDSVYAGVPAKFICTLDEYIEKNKDSFVNTKHLNQNDKKNFLLKEYNL